MASWQRSRRITGRAETSERQGAPKEPKGRKQRQQQRQQAMHQKKLSKLTKEQQVKAQAQAGRFQSAPRLLVPNDTYARGDTP